MTPLELFRKFIWFGATLPLCAIMPMQCPNSTKPRTKQDIDGHWTGPNLISKRSFWNPLSSMLSTRHFSEHWSLNNRPCRTVSCTESWIPQRTHSSPREFFWRKIISHFICQLAWCQVQPKMMSRSKHFIDWQKRCFQRQSELLLLVLLLLLLVLLLTWIW